MHVGQVRHQRTTADNTARTLRTHRQSVQGDDRPSSHIGGASRQTRPNRTAIGQEAPTRQVVQVVVWPSNVR